MRSWYENQPFSHLRRMMYAKKQNTPVVEEIYHARLKKFTETTEILAFLAQEEPIPIYFPRFPQFHIILSCGTPLIVSEPEEFTATCYLLTTPPVSSARAARQLLRPFWGELNEPLFRENQALWSFTADTAGGYFELCHWLCYDDIMELSSGTLDRLESLREARRNL